MPREQIGVSNSKKLIKKHNNNNEIKDDINYDSPYSATNSTNSNSDNDDMATSKEVKQKNASLQLRSIKSKLVNNNELSVKYASSSLNLPLIQIKLF
jgi:hypothetical protein